MDGLERAWEAQEPWAVSPALSQACDYDGVRGQPSRMCAHIRRQRSHIHKPSPKGRRLWALAGTTVTFLLSWFAYFRVFLTRAGFLKEGEPVLRNAPCVIIVTVTVSPRSGAVSFRFTKSLPALEGGPTTPARDRWRSSERGRLAGQQRAL